MSISEKSPALRELKPWITVFGVGGAGGNAVNNMIRAGLQGVDFVVANTDVQALTMAETERIIQMGVQMTEGLGAGSRPDVGRAAAEEVLDEINAHLSGVHMLFVTAGMGGGTGSGASPVCTAREMGILTVGVVTKLLRIAEQGIAELRSVVDTLIIIPNQNLFRIANEIFSTDARCAMRLLWNTGDHDPDRCGGGALRAESCPTDFVEHQSARSATEHIRVQDFFVCLTRECTWAAALVFGHADHRSRGTRATRSTGWAGRTGRARWTLITFFTLHRLAIATRGKKHAKKSYRQNVPHIRSLGEWSLPNSEVPPVGYGVRVGGLEWLWRGPPNRGPQVASEKPKRTLPDLGSPRPASEHWLG